MCSCKASSILTASWYWVLGYYNSPKPLPDTSQDIPKITKKWPRPDQKVTPTSLKSVPQQAQTCVKIKENTFPTCLKKVTCAPRESNRVPPTLLQTRSTDQSTRLFSPQNIASVKISYVSKIENVCGRSRRGFFRAQNSDPVFFRHR